MNLRIISAREHTITKTIDLMNRGFSDYLVQLEFEPTRFSRQIAQDGLDLSASGVVLDGDRPLGFAMLSRRGWNSRIAAMAVVPEVRRNGVGRHLMDHLIDAARKRGDRRIELEVIDSNEGAIALYQSAGFKPIRRLLSFKTNKPGPGQGAALEEVDPGTVARMVVAFGIEGLPWQVSGASLAHYCLPHRAYQLANAYAIISDPEKPLVRIHTIVVRPLGRLQGQAKALLNALFAKFPSRSWEIAPHCPEEVGGFFQKSGFEPGDISQLHMAMDLVVPQGQKPNT